MFRSLPVVAVALLSLAAGTATAHNLAADVKPRGDRYAVEAFYDDNTPARKAHVTIHDGAKQVIAEGLTDAEGRWEFARPAAGKYLVVVDAGAGHRYETDLVVPPAAPATQPLEPSASAGVDRDEFTRVPWLNIATGLAAIGLLAAAWLAWRRLRQESSS
jgi:hypothetical protein